MSIVLDAAFIYSVLVWPGWRAVPFLTDEAQAVVPLVVMLLVVGLIMNVAWLLADPPWSRAVGEAVSAAFLVVVGVRLWQVFPFDFGSAKFPWHYPARFLLAVIIAGTAIGVLVSLIRFAVEAVRPRV